MSKWRMPGQPFTIEIDGVTITCKPMTRKESMALAASSQIVKGDGDMEPFYEELAGQVKSISGWDGDIAEAISYQSHEWMLDLFRCILGASELADDESKNSKPSSAGPQPAGSVEPTAEPESVST